VRNTHAFENKKVLVIGLAKSGVNVAKLLYHLGADVTVNDRTPLEESVDAQGLVAEGIKVVSGGHPLELLDGDVDFVVKNPGIPYSNPLVSKAVDKGLPVYTEIEIAQRVMEGTVLGITGSNGKTTTTTLTNLMLQESFPERRTFACGNIGVPLSQLAEDSKETDIYVTELSSFQLMGIEEFRPKVACIVNIFSAHLDYHGSREEYVKANWSNAMRDANFAKGGSGHYAKGIYKVAKEYGLNSTFSEETIKEYAEKGLQPYENTVGTYDPKYLSTDADQVLRKTVGEMKEKLYDDLIELVSHKNDYLHTQGILQFDYANETVYFGGVAQSVTDDYYTRHFLTSIRTTNVDGSKWDKTPIANPLSNTNKEQEIAKARQTLADAMTARKDAQAKLEATTKAESDAQTALQNAQAHLSALNNGENPLANAQKTFDEAKARHDKAVVTLANANALVNNLTASKATKEETLKDAQATLKDAEKALQTAQDVLKAEEDKMANLEAIASTKAQAVSTAKKALHDAQDSVKQAEKELADLKGAKARLVELKAELEQAEKELKEVYKAQNKAKVDFEVKSLAADRAKFAYETAKAKYDEAETKRLVALADAKRKELEHLGYKPVPVVDGKGNVVDYKAEKVTVGTKDDKTYQAPAQATNAKSESKKQLPNTGTKESSLLAVLGASIGLLALVGKRKYR